MDLKVNDERLDTESLKNQELYAKYLDIKSNFELLMYKAKGDYKILYRDKWEYYGGKSDAKIYETKPFDLKVLKSDLSIYIESDEEIITIENKIVYLETVINSMSAQLMVFLEIPGCFANIMTLTPLFYLEVFIEIKQTPKSLKQLLILGIC